MNKGMTLNSLNRNEKGQFLKGFGFWTGKKRPGLRTSTTFKKGNIPWNAGTAKPKKKRQPKPTNTNILCACNCGRTLWEFDSRGRKRAYVTGHNTIHKKLSIETRSKISQTLGKKKGWVTPKNRIIRNSIEYSLWRKAVFERDDYTCQMCNKRGVEVHADHIKPFSMYPNLRFAIDNGRTLCKECHMQTDTWGGRVFKGGGAYDQIN